MRLRTVTTIACTFLLIHIAHAQEDSAFLRKGFVFGASIGVANSNLTFPDASENYSGLSLDSKIGYMVNPKLAILLTSNVSIYDYSGFGRDRKRDFGVLAPSLQYWVKDKVWVLGGIGIGGDNPVFWDIKDPDNDALETKYYSGVGFIAAIGYELFQSNRNFTVDIKARTMYRNVTLQEGKTSGFSYGIMLGINFY